MFSRFYDHAQHGPDSAACMFSMVKTVAAANPAMAVTQFPRQPFNQPSVIARIPGSSSDLVIMGAHYDSKGGGADARAPGAVDNASGVVALLEALRILAGAGFKPKDTIEFHFYAGEEGGMLGLADVFAKYKADAKTVLAMVNQDIRSLDLRHTD